MLLPLFITLTLNAGQRFSCGRTQVQDIRQKVAKMDIAKVAMIHRRAKTEDYARYKLNSVDEKRFRDAIRERYEAGVKEFEERIEKMRAAHSPTIVATRGRRRHRRVRFHGIPQETKQQLNH